MISRIQNSIGHILFSIGILSTILAYFTYSVPLYAWITLAITFTYLAFGWLIFKRYVHGSNALINFLLGYFYSGTFLGTVFISRKWPGASDLLHMSVFWAVVAFCFVIFLKYYMKLKIPKVLYIETFLLICLTFFFLVS
jgi:hypothetical protein